MKIWQQFQHSAMKLVGTHAHTHDDRLKQRFGECHPLHPVAVRSPRFEAVSHQLFTALYETWKSILISQKPGTGRVLLKPVESRPHIYTYILRSISISSYHICVAQSSDFPFRFPSKIV
jgi:hypothetical protein